MDLGDKVRINVASLALLLEFGARSIGEPRGGHLCECNAASYVSAVSFQSFHPFVMLAKRRSWEKASAVYGYCQQYRIRGERLSRHWYDLLEVGRYGARGKALADRALALSVARHKAMLCREKDGAGNWVGYEAAVSGEFQVVPDGPAYRALSDDCDRMLADEMLLDDEEQFDDVMERCADTQQRANWY